MSSWSISPIRDYSITQQLCPLFPPGKIRPKDKNVVSL